MASIECGNWPVETPGDASLALSASATASARRSDAAQSVAAVVSHPTSRRRPICRRSGTCGSFVSSGRVATYTCAVQKVSASVSV